MYMCINMYTYYVYWLFQAKITRHGIHAACSKKSKSDWNDVYTLQEPMPFAYRIENNDQDEVVADTVMDSPDSPVPLASADAVVFWQFPGNPQRGGQFVH